MKNMAHIVNKPFFEHGMKVVLLKKWGVAVQGKVDRCRDKKQHLVVGINRCKVQLMYQQREKLPCFNSL
jgi:hypothetical protein